jgi:hypothetical protein
MEREDIYVALKTQIRQFETEFRSKKLDTEPFEECRVKFKRCDDCIIVLYIPSDVKTNQRRSIDGDWNFAKYRAEKAWCICILQTLTAKLLQKYQHYFRSYNKWDDEYCVPITYIINTFVVPDGFDTHVETICGQGIHYFNHWLAAYFYERCRYVEKSVEFSEDGKVLAFYERDQRIGEPTSKETDERLTTIIQEAEKKYHFLETQEKGI